jgi:hypothetical protein
MNKTIITYEVVGDFLKVFEAGGVQDVKTTFNYIKNGNIEIIGPTYTPKTITILSSGNKIVIDGSGVDHYNNTVFKYVPDLKRFVRTLMGVIDPFAIIKIPKGQTDVVTMEEIKDGTLMVDFHDEREKYHRYYTEDTYTKLNNNKNPFNNKVIENADVKYYIAELDASLPVQEGGRRNSSRNKTIRMKKSDYLREHHHLFKVLSRPTRRVLARELKVQKKELKERGFKG